MRSWWVVFCGAAAFGCGDDSSGSPADYTPAFVGQWECANGTRNIDCGQGIVVADLSLSTPHQFEFTASGENIVILHIETRSLVPGLPGGPACELPFHARQDEALLQAESRCTDDDGGTVVVHDGTATPWAGQLALDSASTTSKDCAVESALVCYRIAD